APKPMAVGTRAESVKKTNRLVTVEEGWRQSGVGAEIAASVTELAFDWLDAPILRVTGKDVPMPYAANLEKLALPTVAGVIEAVKTVSYRGRPGLQATPGRLRCLEAPAPRPGRRRRGGAAPRHRQRRPARIAAPGVRRPRGLGDADRRHPPPRRAYLRHRGQVPGGADHRAH